MIRLSGYFQNYFGDPWNCFDFFIVLGSLIDIVYEVTSVSIVNMNVSSIAELTLICCLAIFTGGQSVESIGPTNVRNELSPSVPRDATCKTAITR